MRAILRFLALVAVLVSPALGQTISNLSYSVTNSTIVATWTTDTSSNSNITCGGKNGIDNGVAANSTSHQAVVAGLLNLTAYSCTVTSGSTTTSPQNVTTSAAPTRIPIVAASLGAIQQTGRAGDSYYTFVSSDNSTYVTQDDGKGITGSDNAGANFQICKFTNESTLAGSNVNIMSSYLGINTSDSTDGPAGIALRGGAYGIFGLNGRLFMHVGRNNQGAGPTPTNWYGNIIGDNADHAATWNRYDIPTSFSATGQGTAHGIFEFASSTFGHNSPVRYGPDDGTLGYNTAGNQIDGGNAYVYIEFKDQYSDTKMYMMRTPRIQYNAQNSSAFEYWVGSASNPTPADFVNDSNWSTSATGRVSVFNPSFNFAGLRMTFIAGVNRYIITVNESASSSNTTWHFFEAPTPVGPWTEFLTANWPTTGYNTTSPFHRDAYSNVLTNAIPMKLLFSGDFNQAAVYKINYATLTLFTQTNPVTNTRVQSRAQSAAAQSGTTWTLAYNSNVASGNLLTMSFRAADATHTLNSVTDTLGNTWTVVYYGATGSTLGGGWAYTFSAASGADTVSMNWATSQTGGVMAIAEYHGPNAVRATSLRVAGTSTTPLSNPIIPVAGDLLVGVTALNTSTAVTAGSGYNINVTGGNGAGAFFTSIEDNLSASGGSATAGFTATGAADWNAGIGAFYNNTPALGPPFLNVSGFLVDTTGQLLTTSTVQGGAYIASNGVLTNPDGTTVITVTPSSPYVNRRGILVNPNGAMVVTTSKSGGAFLAKSGLLVNPDGTAVVTTTPSTPYVNSKGFLVNLDGVAVVSNAS